MGKILWVNLSDGTVSEQEVDEQLYKDYIGGYGLGARLLYDELKPGIDPLSDQNILAVCTGPLTGTPTIEGNRFMVVCKSPLTGGWGDANSGGSFGPYLKFSGFDAVFFKGASENPVYLLIDNGQVQIKDATFLWGRVTDETERLLKEIHGQDARVLTIGPAGENMSRIAAIIHEGRAAARSGCGAVMGSKKLKAIVVKGNKEVPLADPEKVKELRKKYMRLPSREYKTLTETGTIGILATAIETGDSPVKNWKGDGPTTFPNGIEKFAKDKIMKYQKRRKGCWRCTIACGGIMEVKDGPYAIETDKVEYESAAAFGPLILNDDFESIIYINDLCNKLGFDTISAGSVIAFAMECTEHGLFESPELQIQWGDAQKTIEFLKKMATRQGEVALLTDGVKVASEKIGPESYEYAIHVNGQELPFHDPRYQSGMATTYATEPTPGRHCPAEWILPPGLDFPEDLDRHSPENKGWWQKKMVCQMQVINSTGLCQFAYYSYPVNAWPEFLQAVTGLEFDLDKFDLIGERILNLRHAFNLREGLNPLKYTFPKRALGWPPLEAGQTKGVQVDLEYQITDYFQQLDWDLQTSYPSRKKLEQLGLDFVAQDLYREGDGGEERVS
ncbi:MAG: aldehyde ferredoxin oxidoreductase family protein [Firmicutes bacterium]|nr:aldehyde ferredoxin oxidoreductase family protein [Bacillota bacterium]